MKYDLDDGLRLRAQPGAPADGFTRSAEINLSKASFSALISRLRVFGVKKFGVYYFNLMAEKHSVSKVPSAARLAAARLYNRYNVEIDELDKTTAERIKELCSEHNLSSEIEADRATGLYKISITGANLPIIEQIEGILDDPGK